MSLVAAIEAFFAEKGDAALLGLKHLASEVEKLGNGGLEPAAIEAKIKGEVHSVLDPFLADLRQAFETRMKGLEDGLAAVSAYVNTPPANAAVGAPAALSA